MLQKQGFFSTLFLYRTQVSQSIDHNEQKILHQNAFAIGGQNQLGQQA